MSRTNKERAFDAALAMASHSSRTGVHAEAADIQISDLLSNLMHLMDTQDLDQDECLDRAATHYREEWAEEHKQFMGIPVVSDGDLPQSVRDTMAQIDTAMAAEKQEEAEVCDWCTNDVPNGEGHYVKGSDGDRVCKGCLTIHTLRMEKEAWREQCRQVGHWTTHIDLHVSDWKDEVENDCTRQSYKDWVESQMEIRSDESE